MKTRRRYLALSKNLLSLFAFKTVSDAAGNTFVLPAAFDETNLTDETIADKTAFEAVETHMHLLDNLSKRECAELEGLADTLGHTLLSRLNAQYPDRDFLVYVTLSHDGMIARFHQHW